MYASLIERASFTLPGRCLSGAGIGICRGQAMDSCRIRPAMAGQPLPTNWIDRFQAS